jgi:DNA-binding transcriptional MerR regulator
MSFTRQEVIAMTGIKAGKLSYLDSTGLVIPEKRGNPKRPVVIYSVEQVIQLKIIQRLREKLSLQEIRKALNFLKSKNYQPSLFECNLVLIGDELFLVEDKGEFGEQVLRASGQNMGQIIVQEIGAIGDVINELRVEAEKNHVLDFQKRTKDTLLELIKA